MGIDNPVAAIGDQNVTVFALPKHHLPGNAAFGKCLGHGALGRRQAKRDHLHRQRKAAEGCDPFGIVGDDNHAIGSCGDNLLAQQRATTALDRIERRIDFVGAVDRKVEAINVVKRGQANAAAQRVGAGHLRSRHADHIEPGAHPFAQQVDKMLGGRTGAKSEPHAVARMFERGLEADGRAASLAEIDRMTANFVDYYAAHIADASRPFDGLESALDDLAGRGYQFAVCTNKLEWLSKKLLDELGLSRRFSAICGADTFGVSKPDPAILRQTVARARGELSSTIMVGDAGPDIGVARRAGVPVIAVEFGYAEVPIADLGPDLLIGNMTDLPAAVESLWASRNAIKKSM